MHSQVLAGIRQELEEYVSQASVTHPKKPKARITRRHRPDSERPRIARRWVPRHSVALVLDWDLTPSERLALLHLLSWKRDAAGQAQGFIAAALAKQFGHDARSGRRWLAALERQGYVVTRPGRLRGWRILTFTKKATRYCQLREADLKPKPKKTRKPANPPVSEPSRTLVSELKDQDSLGTKKPEVVDKSAPVDKPRPVATPNWPSTGAPPGFLERYYAEKAQQKAEAAAKQERERALRARFSHLPPWQRR